MDIIHGYLKGGKAAFPPPCVPLIRGFIQSPLKGSISDPIHLKSIQITRQKGDRLKRGRGHLVVLKAFQNPSTINKRWFKTVAENDPKLRSGGGLGGFWAAQRRFLGPLGGSLGRLGSLLGLLEASWGVLGRLGAVLRRLGAVLRAS